MPFICEKCGHSFDSQAKLKVHMNRKISCVFEISLLDPLICNFCNRKFTKTNDLTRHNVICKVKSAPNLLVEQIEKQKTYAIKIIKEKETLIQERDIIIEELKNLLPVKSTIPIIPTTKYQPYAFRVRDMCHIIDTYFRDNLVEFTQLSDNIYKYMKKYDLKTVMEISMKHFHDNPKFRGGRNIMYCNSGEHIGKFLTFNPDEEFGFNDWYITNLTPILEVISMELWKIKMHKSDIDMKNMKRIPYTALEEYNVANCESDFYHLNKNPKCFEYAKQIIMNFRSVKIPTTISTKIIDINIPRNKEPSARVKFDIEENKKMIFDDKREIPVVDDDFSGEEPHDSDEESENAHYERRKREKERKIRKEKKLEIENQTKYDELTTLKTINKK